MRSVDVSIALIICLIVPVKGQLEPARPNSSLDPRFRLSGCPFEFSCSGCFACVKRACVPLVCDRTQRCDVVNGRPRCADNPPKNCGTIQCGPCEHCDPMSFADTCIPRRCGECKHCEGGRCVRDNTPECQIQKDPCNRFNSRHLPGC